MKIIDLLSPRCSRQVLVSSLVERFELWLRFLSEEIQMSVWWCVQWRSNILKSRMTRWRESSWSSAHSPRAVCVTKSYFQLIPEFIFKSKVLLFAESVQWIKARLWLSVVIIVFSCSEILRWHQKFWKSEELWPTIILIIDLLICRSISQCGFHHKKVKRPVKVSAAQRFRSLSQQRNRKYSHFRREHQRICTQSDLLIIEKFRVQFKSCRLIN